jgi:hypothetical protein
MTFEAFGSMSGTEVELKLESEEDAREILVRLRSRFAALRVTRWAPRAAVDLYFDLPSDLFLRANATLRARRYQHRLDDAYKLTWKPPPYAESARPGIIVRKEVQNKVAVADVQALEISGKAVRAARKFVRGAGEDWALSVPVEIVSFRNLFGIDVGDGPLATMFVDVVECWQLSDAQLPMALGHGAFELDAACSFHSFQLIEFEATGHYSGREQEGNTLLEEIHDLLVPAVCRPVRLSKYALARRAFRESTGNTGESALAGIAR